MNIGELFISLGVKGADKSVGQLGSVSKGLKETASVSLEAKAALLAATYALESFFAKSGAAGTNLTNFNALTGTAVSTLQQYQYAARQVGVSNESTANSFVSLQNAMTKMRQGEGAPSGWLDVARLTGGFDRNAVDDFIKKPELLLQKLQVYAQKQKNIGVRNSYLKSFGLDDGMIAALSREAFRPEVLKKAPTYSDKEVKSLDKANIAWSNLNNKFQMAIGHFNAMHGNQLVKDASIVIDVVLKLADALVNLANKTHFFENISKGFDKIAEGAGIILPVFMQIGNAIGDFADKTHVFERLGEAFTMISEDAHSVIGFVSGIGDAFAKAAEDAKLLTNLGEAFSYIESISSNVGKLFAMISAQDNVGSGMLANFKAIDAIVQGLNTIITGWKTIFSWIDAGTSTLAKLGESKESANQVKDSFIATALGAMGIPTGALGVPAEQSVTGNLLSKSNSVFKALTDNMFNGGSEQGPMPPLAPNMPALSIVPNLPPLNNNNDAKKEDKNISVDQTFNFQGNGDNSRQVGEIHKKAIQDAFRQLPSQVQGS